MGRRAGRTRGAGRTRQWSTPPAVWVMLGLAALVLINAGYQVARKPSEVVGLVLPSSAKSPGATWARYGPLFREYSTDVVRAELLAALAQVESAGDPAARTYWRWRASLNPFEIYAPASSAVGILQLTDDAFAEARRLCVRDHAVVDAAQTRDGAGCGLTALYFRTVPSHAIEMTSARLHQAVTETLAQRRIRRATAFEKERLAAVVHLCGRGRGVAFAQRGFRTLPGERCGDHDLTVYLARVRRLADTFAQLGAAS